RQGAAHPPRQALRARTRKAARRARRRAALDGGLRRPLREDPHLQLPAGSRHRPPHQLHAPQPRRGARRRHPGPPDRLPQPPHGAAPRVAGASERMSDVWTVRRAILWTASYLEKKGADSPRTDADLLLADALGVDRLRLLLDFDKPLTPADLAADCQLIEWRARGEPHADVLGRKEFFGRDFAVNDKVLVPRPETEALVQFGLEHFPEDAEGRVLDLCAGSGCIGISLAIERPRLAVDLAEIDPGAAEVAARNVDRHGVGDRVRVRVGDLFDAADGRYHAILSNPPYVASGEIPGL